MPGVRFVHRGVAQLLKDEEGQQSHPREWAGT